MEMLKIESLSKTYGSGSTAVQAVKNVSFTVPKGEFTAIVGESGSGKSTLLNIIGGLDFPTSGKVFIAGKDIFALKEKELTVPERKRTDRFPPQEYRLYLPGFQPCPGADRGTEHHVPDPAGLWHT